MATKSEKYEKKEEDEKKKSVTFDSDNEDVMCDEDTPQYSWTHCEDDDEDDEEVENLAANSVSKTYYDMTDDQLVRLCRRCDRPRARRVVHELRKYLIQVSKSEGFDIDVIPGYFLGVTNILPVKYSTECSLVNDDPESLARRVIDHYNFHNKMSMYEVEYVDHMNVSRRDVSWIYYVTFCARDVKMKADRVNPEMAAPLRTFQAVVKIQGMEMMPDAWQISSISLCRVKPN